MNEALASRARRSLAAAPSGVYLNTAAEGLLLRSSAAAWERYAVAKARGALGRAEFVRLEDEARERFATAVSARTEDVAFVASTSRGLDIVLKGIDWSAGDVLVTLAGEFPSTLFNTELLRSQGVEVRTVAARTGAVFEDDIVAAIDVRTRLVVASMVSFRTGQRLDFSPVGTRAREVGALVFADAVQAVGSGEVSMDGIDVLCAATFKWQLGVHGAAGFVVTSRAREILSPSYAGYRSVAELFPSHPSRFRFHDDARRFEEGMPAFPALAVLSASLAELEAWGYANIGEHNRCGVRMLRDGLANLGIVPLLADETVPTGGIVAFESADHERIAGELARQDTAVWARDGRVRLAVHAYTTADDIETVLDQLKKIGM
ncbi:MAG: aminotransferase class V-fold PLP-dependent enzyme [Microbacterium sp.]